MLLLLFLPTCAHIYPDAYKILKTCPQTERAKRAECVRITYLSVTYFYLLLSGACLCRSCACLCLFVGALLFARLCLLLCLLEISHISHLSSDFFSSLYTRTRFPFIVSQVFFCVFFCFFVVSFVVSFFLRSCTPPRGFWSPRWPQVGSILEPCWSHFGAFLGAALASQLKTVLRCDFDRFLIDFRPPESSKNIEKHKVF